MKKKFIGTLLLCALTAAAGCETLPRKFVRKKPKPDHTPSVVYLEQGSQQKKHSNEYYYKTHFTLWKIWQGEILSNLNGNSKKVMRSAEEAYSHLDQMRHYLKPEKSKQLEPRLEEMKRYLNQLQSRGSWHSDKMVMKNDLTRLEQAIVNDFHYKKIKEDILSDV